MSTRDSLQTAQRMPDWPRLAACAGASEATFFPGRDDSPEPALRVCRSCVVRAECLAYALEHDERFGIWGGHTEAERRRLQGDQPKRRRRSLGIVSRY